MKTPPNWQVVTTWFCLGMAVLAIVFDIWIYREGGVMATISRVVTGYAHKYPLIPLLVGILLGHLFFSEGDQP